MSLLLCYDVAFESLLKIDLNIGFVDDSIFGIAAVNQILLSEILKFIPADNCISHQSFAVFPLIL